MALRVVYTRADGGVSVIAPALDSKPANETELQFVTRLRDTLVPVGSTNIGIVDETTIPTNRRFRSVWQTNGTTTQPSMGGMRTVILNEVRARRDALLTESDKDRARLEDIGSVGDRTLLATYRQALRDLPATVTTEVGALTTRLQLENYTPTYPVKPNI